MLRTGFSLLLILALFILIASGPSFIRMESNALSLHPEAVLQSLLDMAERASNGTLMEYQAGRTFHKLYETLPVHFMVSLQYIFVAALLSLLLGLSLAFLTSFHRGNIVTTVLEVLHVMPDFVLAIFLQIGVIAVTQFTGVRIARIAYMPGVSPAYALPITVMTIVASVFIIRLVHGYLQEVKSRDYLLFAVAKGLEKRRILATHLLVPVLCKLRGDLHGLLALLIGNLFILERIFNIPGVTSFIFRNAFQRILVSLDTGNVRIITQMHVALSGFLAVLIIYWLLYGFFLLLFTLVIRWRE